MQTQGWLAIAERDAHMGINPLRCVPTWPKVTSLENLVPLISLGLNERNIPLSMLNHACSLTNEQPRQPALQGRPANSDHYDTD